MIFKGVKGEIFSWNPIRTLQFGSMGILYTAPFMHFNYLFVLPKIAMIGGPRFKVFKKLLFDQTIGAIVFLSGFYVTLNLIKGNSFEYGLETLKQKFWKSWALD